MIIISLLMYGCGINNSLNNNSSEFDFTFTSANHNWTGEFVDLPVNADNNYELAFQSLKDLPQELGTGKAPYIQSMNRSDDVFMYLKHRIEDLQPNTSYTVYFDVRLGTNAGAGMVGVGGAPGESVYVKVGASTQEPKPIVENSTPINYNRLNIDKGNQSTSGNNAVVIGNVAKLSTDISDKFEYKDLSNTNNPLTVTTDANGHAWVLVGTDSAYEGLTQLYYKRIKITFERQ